GQGCVLMEAHVRVVDRLRSPDPLEHPAGQLGGGERAAAQRARDFSRGQLGGILPRTISRRCAARKLAGSVSSDSSIFARAKRATVGATARAMRSASIGASGTRAPVAQGLTASPEIPSA